MNKPLLWWIGLILFVTGGLALITPPENYPGWYQKVWGITHPYKTDATSTEKKSPAIFGQIWVGRGEKGVGGNSRLEFEQPALRKEAADADARVDGRAQHRGYMALIAMIGLFLMILGWMRQDRESDNRRLDRLERTFQPASPPSDEGPTTDPKAQQPSSPFSSDDDDRTSSNWTPPSTASAPLEPVNTDPEPHWWTKLWAPFHRNRHQRTVIAAPAEPIKIVITLESNGQGTKPAEGEGNQEWKAEAKHTLTADLPPMTVRSVNAHIKVGGHNTITDAKLDVQ